MGDEVGVCEIDAVFPPLDCFQHRTHRASKICIFQCHDEMGYGFSLALLDPSLSFPALVLQMSRVVFTLFCFCFCSAGIVLALGNEIIYAMNVGA